MLTDPLEIGRATSEHDTAYDPCRYQFPRRALRDPLEKVVLLTTRHWRRPLCGCKRRTSRRNVVESAGIFTSGTWLVLYISVVETFSTDSYEVSVRWSNHLDLIVAGANAVSSSVMRSKLSWKLTPRHWCTTPCGC